MKNLTLRYTNIGDDGFKHIEKLDRLERLTLDSRLVTNDALAHLPPLKNLRHLELRATDVSDEGLKHVSNISSLNRLDLSCSGEPGVNVGRNFTPAGLAHLKDLPNLSVLFLTNADVGWTSLRELAQLKALDLLMPTMGADEVRQLQKALPDTHVSAAWGGTGIAPMQDEKAARKSGDPNNATTAPEKTEKATVSTRATETQFSKKQRSAIWFHSGQHVHFVLYHEGFLQSGMSYSEYPTEKTWRFQGSINILDGRKFSLLHESKDPDRLVLNGKSIDLRKGRVIVLNAEGDTRQLDIAPPAAKEENVAQLGRSIQQR